MKSASSIVPRARLIIVSWVVMATVGAIAVGSAMADQPLPAHATFRGKTLAEWSFLQNEWLVGIAEDSR